jgi:ADP-ribosylglycohydrolase
MIEAIQGGPIMTKPNKDRAAGAIMGALIGDALGLGCHWYYNLDELHRDHGPWISGYTTPIPDRYHSGMQAGQLSQSGLILVMLLKSLIEQGQYREDDFTLRLDRELFPLLDGTPMYGPGGYTNQSIREAYHKRVVEHKSWHESGGHADTSEAAERGIVLAARYAKDPQRMAAAVSSNCTLTQSDEAIICMSTAYNCVLSLLVNGEKLTPAISDKMMQMVKSGKLPFHSVTKDKFAAPSSGYFQAPLAGQFSSPDALLTPHYAALTAVDPDIRIEPAWKVSLVYGMPCAIYHVLPAAYYLAARFADDFESAVLHAINGGGQNMSRAMLTGALVGAQVGLGGIPQRFIDGLENGQQLCEMALQL